jgi:hypothetical protein
MPTFETIKKLTEKATGWSRPKDAGLATWFGLGSLTYLGLRMMASFQTIQPFP